MVYGKDAVSGVLRCKGTSLGSPKEKRISVPIKTGYPGCSCQLPSGGLRFSKSNLVLTVFVLCYVLCAVMEEFILLMLIRVLDESVLVANNRGCPKYVVCVLQVCMGTRIRISSGYELDTNTEWVYPKGIWWWCITFGLHGFLDFVRHSKEHNVSENGSVSVLRWEGWWWHLLCGVL
jgi:hypothetical protein